MYGELLPVGGGDPIPLLKKSLLVGRRESCDVVLRFSNVSAHHCQLAVDAGYWHVRDMNSRNGVRVNGLRVTEKRLDPGDVLSLATHRYEVKYSPVDLGAVGPPPPEVPESDIFNKSLLERAGLSHQRLPKTELDKTELDKRNADRYDITKDEPGQLHIRQPIPEEPV
jgi:predicted component of type VI protein secretion system